MKPSEPMAEEGMSAEEAERLKRLLSAEDDEEEELEPCFVRKIT